MLLIIGVFYLLLIRPQQKRQRELQETISKLKAGDRVVTTGFANLSDGAKVFIGKDDAAPTADLAPRKRSRAPDGKGGGPSKEGQAKDGKRSEGDQKGQTGPAPAPGSAASSGPKQ